MASYFNNQKHIEIFAIGFDFVKGYLSGLRIAEILNEINAFSETCPDHLETTLSLDALNDAISDHPAAIGALMSYNIDNSLITLRLARQRATNDQQREVEPLLEFVVGRYLEISSVRQLCAMIAYGRMDDAKAFSKTWDTLIEQYSINDHVPEKDLIENPMKYVLLPDLPFREQIEAIDLMLTFEVTRCRDAEILALVQGFRNYLSFLVTVIAQNPTNARLRKSLPAITVVEAIALGCADAAEEIVTSHGAVTSKRIRAAAEEEIERIRSIEVKMKVLEALIRWSVSEKRLVSEILPVLRHYTYEDDEPIAEMLLLMNAALPSRTYKELQSRLNLTKQHDSRLQDTELEGLISHGKYIEALAYADKHNFLKPDDERYITLKLQSLTQDGRFDEAMLYTTDLLESGNTFANQAMMFEILQSVSKIEDLLAYKPIFEILNMRAGQKLLCAYDQMKKGDVKGGLETIERAKKLGLHEDAALVFTARFLLATGYPKRVVSVCGKMLRKDSVSRYAYPLLITAYRELGDEEYAQHLEMTYQRLNLR